MAAFRGGAPLAALVLLLAALLQHTQALDQELLEGCLRRTGLKEREILSINLRNGRCSVDCATKQTTVLTYFKPDGSSCGAPEHLCRSGRCQPAANGSAVEQPLEQLDLEIVEGRVPDLDQSANGDTDAFVVVAMARDAPPHYRKDDVLCHTFIVQDSDRPQWRFKCLGVPLPPTALLKLTAYDADPARAELIGSVVYGLEYLKSYNGAAINVPLFRRDSTLEQVGHLRVRAFVSAWAPGAPLADQPSSGSSN